LKPGGHILAFGGSRTWHRLAVAVEDAGFELRDSIAWIYGSGFPKSLDVSKAIEKKLGVQPIGKKPAYGAIASKKLIEERGWNNIENALIMPDTQTEEGKQWAGWGTALKPAFEPVVVGRKPFGKGVTVAENVLAWGVGGLNIDGSRISTNGEKIAEFGTPTKSVGGLLNNTGQPMDEEKLRASYDKTNTMGRWPANVILDEVTAGLLDEQTGVSVSRTGVNPEFGRKGGIMGVKTPRHDAGTPTGHNDTGGASRFFYQAKASKRDRNEGLEGLESRGNRINAPREDENAKHSTVKQNFHPTVKPTQLMRYLIKLVTPEGGTVLDPFTGSGSTGKAALLDGYKFVGVELTAEYLPIIEGRLRWAMEQEGETDGETLF
jgi:hypothetical protein